MKLQDVKVDFHVNGWISEATPKQFWRRGLINFLNEQKLSLPEIVDLTYSPTENKALFLVSYWLPKYDRLIERSTEDLRKLEIDDSNKETFLGITKNKGDSWLYLCKGHELLPNQGHVLALGADYHPRYNFPQNYSDGPHLEEKLKEAKDNDAIIVPPHPLPNLTNLEKFYLKYIAKDPSGKNLGLNEEEIRKSRDYFDAIEIKSSVIDNNQTERIEKLSKELELPPVYTSDGNMAETFTHYSTFDWIDFSSPKKMRESFRKAFNNDGNSYSNKSNNQNKPFSKLSLLPHALMPLIVPRNCY